MPMTEVVLWVVLTLIEAAILHLAAIWFSPRLVSRLSARRLLKFAGRLNTLGYRGLPLAGRHALTTNPDMVTAFGIYDVSQGPVRIACAIPDWDSYWSISLYAWNTENFCVINDRTARSGEFDLVIVSGKSRYQSSEREEVAFSPTNKGIVLVRMLVRDRDDPEELERVEAVMRRNAVVSGTGGPRVLLAGPVKVRV
jgi:uncharacterized membrane protein